MQSREKLVKTLLTKTSNFKENILYALWVIWRKTTGKVLFGVPMQVKLYPKPLPGGSTPECCQYCMAQLHPLECQQSTSGHNPGELPLPLPVTNCQELLSYLWPLEALPLSTWDFDWLALVQDLGIWSQSLWVCVGNGSIIARKQFYSNSPLPLALHSPQTSSSMIYEPCRERIP